MLLKSEAQAPNVIFILADDLGYGELGCYGNEQVHTPHLDQLAQEGLTFYRAYANSTVCSPSRAAILFGDYPDRVGVPGVIRDMPHNTWGNLRDDLKSLPEQMKGLGYQTTMIGKWHLGYEAPDVPNSRGFDYFKGFLGDMMDDYYTHLRGGVNWMRENDLEIDPKGHATDLFTDWGIGQIRERAGDDQPFFMYLAYNAPHDPVQPPADHLTAVQQRLPEITLKRQKMVAFIEHLDTSIGRVVEALKQEGIFDNTLIVFTSDNGGALGYGANNQPYNGGKGDMLEGGIRIPCVVSWPDRITQGEEHRPLLLMDFYRMIPQWVTDQEISLIQREDMVWVRREGHRFGGRAYYAISDGRYKLLQNGPFEPYQLFDLSVDSLESQPIQNMEVRKRLMQSLTQHIKQAGSIPWQ